MTLHDAPGGIDSTHNTAWAFDATSTSTSTSSTSTSSTSHSTSSTSHSTSLSSTSSSVSSTSTSISSTSTSSTSTSISSTSSSISSTSTSLSTSSTSISTTQSTSSSTSFSSSTSATTLPPYTSQIISGMGVNYKNAQSSWASDMDYFNSIGLKNIRPNMPGTPIPWSVGTVSSGSYAFWRLCAQTFSQNGFWVTWGSAGNNPITSSTWPAMHDSIVAEATYLQEQGIVLGDYEIGNEMELKVDGTTITKGKSLNDLLRQLALDVKAVYNLGQISYGATTDATTLNDWIANGLGGLDTISIHPYGNVNAATQTVSISGFSQIAAMMQTFGDRCYISEFNLDAGASDIISLNSYAQITTMQNFLHNFILASHVSKFIIYEWYNAFSPVTELGFFQSYNNGTFNPMWYVFFTQQSQLLPKGKVRRQLLKNTPIPTGTVLVDDPVALVDDPNALTGSQTTQIRETGSDAQTNAPKAHIKPRR